MQEIIDYICNGKFDYTQCARFPSQEKIDESNTIREEFKQRLRRRGFRIEDFYVPMGHPLRADNDTLFYKLAFSVESKIAGTGLFESSFRTVFTNPRFKEIIKYICPEIVEGGTAWNFEDNDILLGFCNGIFKDDFPYYKDVLTIRLASYFHPKYFLPIFKLEELQKLCKLCSDSVPEPDPRGKGTRLFKYNSFLLAKMVALPVDNYIKSHIAYLAFYTVDLYNRLRAGEQFPAIYQNYPTQWEKDFITCGQGILIHLNLP